ncbi:epoxide hydrolase EphB [Mycobacterium tuberculosis variant africanum]|nr:epoxide hydrolase EphB [Mycobacterium tuberculosis variant africanum]
MRRRGGNQRSVCRSRRDRPAGQPVRRAPSSDYHLELAGPGRVWYQDYFAVQDGIITEIEEDLRGWLLGLTYTVSGEG